MTCSSQTSLDPKLDPVPGAFLIGALGRVVGTVLADVEVNRLLCSCPVPVLLEGMDINTRRDAPSVVMHTSIHPKSHFSQLAKELEALEASGWLDTSGPTPPPAEEQQATLPRPSLEAALAEAEASLLPLHHRLACHGVCRGASRRGAPSEALSKSTSCGTLGPVRGCVLRSVSLWMSPVHEVWGCLSYGCGAGPGKQMNPELSA